jgi:integrase
VSHLSRIPATPGEPSNAPSLATLLARILADAALPERRRTEMASALRSTAKALRRPLETVPASPVELRPLLAGLTPAMARVSAGRWRNVLSLLGAALNHHHGNLLPRRSDLQPSPAWSALLALIEAEGRHTRFYLARFARHATDKGVEPEAVDGAFLARFAEDLTYRSLDADPARVAREVARAWNRAGETYPSWPSVRLPVPDNRVRHSLPWEAFPSSLQEDAERWLDHLGRDPLAERDFRPLRPASIEGCRKHLRLYLGALVEAGENPAEMTSLAAVVTPEHARCALRVVWERRGRKATAETAQIASLVISIARHWAGLDSDDIARLGRLAAAMRPNRAGLAERNERRLAQLKDPGRLDEVLTLPERIAGEVRRAGPPTKRLAQEFQTAVAVELFLMTGLRISNVAGLRIGETLLLGHDGSVSIRISAAEVKNRVPLHCDLLAPSATLLRRYLTDYRPLLGDPSSPWLFPGNRPGRPKTEDAFREAVTRAMARRCGVSWHPHPFRHLLAELQLDDNAGADGVVTRALGHKHGDTTRLHYAGFQSARALRLHDELVLRRRASAKPARRRGRR